MPLRHERGHRYGVYGIIPRERRAYFGRLSGPLVDRIDVNVTVPEGVSSTELAGGQVNESSAQIRERVMAARQAQRERLEPYGLKTMRR